MVVFRNVELVYLTIICFQLQFSVSFKLGKLVQYMFIWVWGSEMESSFWCDVMESGFAEKKLVFDIVESVYNCCQKVFVGTPKLFYWMFSPVRRRKINQSTNDCLIFNRTLVAAKSFTWKCRLCSDVLKSIPLIFFFEKNKVVGDAKVVFSVVHLRNVCFQVKFSARPPLHVESLLNFGRTIHINRCQTSKKRLFWSHIAGNQGGIFVYLFPSRTGCQTRPNLNTKVPLQFRWPMCKTKSPFEKKVA